MSDEGVVASGPPPVPDQSPAIARRSISIFSRRGTDTPVSKGVYVEGFSQSSPPMSAAQQPPVPKIPPKKAWKLGSGHGGTILRAVPKHSKSGFDKQSTCRSPTSYEIESAANEEILRNAFGDASNYPSHQAGMSPTMPVSPVSELFGPCPLPGAVSFPLNERSSTILRKPLPRVSKTQSKDPLKGKAETIGVWKDGQVYWDQSYSAVSSTVPSTDVSSIDTRPSSTASATSLGSFPHPKSPRPRIQVVIPETNYRTLPPSHTGPLLSVPRFPGDINQRPKTAPEQDSELASGETLPLQTALVPPTISTSAPTPQRPTPSPNEEIPSSVGELQVMRRSHRFRPSMASSISSTQTDDGENFRDDASNYSAGSSRTSVDSLCLDDCPEIRPLGLHRSGSVAFSIISPAKAGVFDESRMNSVRTIRSTRRLREEAINEPFTPLSNGMLPSPRPMDAAQAALRLTRWLESRARKPQISTRLNAQAQVRRVTPPDLALVRSNTLHRSKSPTLSEAEADLEAQLTAISDRFQWDRDCPEEPAKTANAPPIPARKSRRNWQPVTNISIPNRNPLRNHGQRCVSDPCAEAASAPLARARHMETVQRPSSANSKLQYSMKERIEQTVSPQAAEMVILRIFENLGSVEDLLAASGVNKGFYRVYKRNQLHLLKTTLRNESATAWEFMETSVPSENVDSESAEPKPEWTAKAYLESYRRNRAVIEAIKGLCLQRCRSILRMEIVRSLESSEYDVAARANNALWRIWTFCGIFGSGKGREDDIVGQMDWLRGGLLAHQNSCTSTMLTTDSFYMSNVLLNASEHFARGNEGGLSAEQLYDVTEMWTCLRVFFQGLEGRTDQARSYGVFESTDVRGGDVDGEEAMLEEWQYYLFTLGLSTILAMASISCDMSPAPFALAADNKWMAWSPPIEGGSRTTFLKEAVARVYEERIATGFQSPAAKAEADRQQRQRGRSFAAELRQQRVRSESQRVNQVMEHPMSGYAAISELDSERNSPASAGSSVSSPAVTTNRNPSVRSAASSRRTVASTRSHLTVVSPLETISETRNSAVAEQFQELERIATGGTPANSVDGAVQMITEMGFSERDARMALRVTDIGDGLRVDRAIEWLLRR